MTVPVTVLAPSAVLAAAAASRHGTPVAHGHPRRHRGDAPLDLAPVGLRPSAPSGERVVGLVRCTPETERALETLPFVAASADAAERRVHLATIFLLSWGGAEVLVPGMWIGALIAMLLLVAALWSFFAARTTLGSVRRTAATLLEAEGCFPAEIEFLTRAGEEPAIDAVPSRRLAGPGRARLQLVR